MYFPAKTKQNYNPANTNKHKNKQTNKNTRIPCSYTTTRSRENEVAILSHHIINKSVTHSFFQLTSKYL